MLFSRLPSFNSSLSPTLFLFLLPPWSPSPSPGLSTPPLPYHSFLSLILLIYFRSFLILFSSNMLMNSDLQSPEVIIIIKQEIDSPWMPNTSYPRILKSKWLHILTALWMVVINGNKKN